MHRPPHHPLQTAGRPAAPWLVALAVAGAFILSALPAAADDAPAAPTVAPAAAPPDAVAFGIAVEQGDIATVGTWLGAGLNPDFEGDRIGTGLMIAAWHGNIAMMELFLTHGADVNHANQFNEQALMHAVWKDQRAAAEWLIEHGARINRDGNEWSALHYAAFAGQESMARLLIQKGANINAKSTNGSTVLMMAAHEGHEKIAALLIDAGAIRGERNDLGENALTWAMRYENLSIAKMVSSEGEFAQAAAEPKEKWGDAVVTLPAPAEVENILQQERLARAGGRPRVLSDDEYRKVLARVAQMKRVPVAARHAKRLSITAKKSDPRKERAELQFGK